MDGASTKDSCYILHHNIETTPPQLDNTQRLSRMIEEIPDICDFKLKHEPKKPFIFYKSCRVECLKADNWLDIRILQ